MPDTGTIEVIIDPRDGSRIDENELTRSLIGSIGYLPAEAFTGTTITRNLKIPYLPDWENHPEKHWVASVKSILGYASRGAGPSRITRWLPWTDLLQPALVASRVDVYGWAYRGTDPRSDPDSFPPLSVVNRYKYITATVHFSAPRFKLGDRLNDDPTELEGDISGADIETVRFCTKTIVPTVSYITGQRGSIFYDDDTLPDAAKIVPYQVPLFRGTAEVIVDWYGVPLDCVPMTAIRECLGKVNLFDLDLPDIPPPKKYPAGTLRFESYALRDDFFADAADDSSRCQHIRYVFKERNIQSGGLTYGWNSEIYLGDGLPRNLKLSNGNPPFERTTFDTMFMGEP